MLMPHPPRMVLYSLAAALVLLPLASASAQFSAITIDDQPTAEQKLLEINNLRSADRYDDAVELVQELVDGSRFKLVGTGDGAYIDAERWVRRELERDPVLQAAYRKRFTAEAERVAGQAIASGQVGELRDAYRRYAVTQPGFEVGLFLTGLLLESGDAPSASALSLELLDHPDALRRQSEVLSLHGAAAALMGDNELVEDVARRLNQAGDPAAAAALTALAGSVTHPMSGWSRPVVDAGPAPSSLDQPLWSEPMARRGTDPSAVRPEIDGQRILPVASRDLILINTTRQVLAMDRAAGPALWAYPENNATPDRRIVRPQRSAWPDTRGVALAGGRVFAVLGECNGLSRNNRSLVTPNRLVCLDRSSGSELWNRLAGEVLEGEPLMFSDRRGERVNLHQTHFVGTPIIADGQVLVMLRRASDAGQQTNWLLSFDSGTGELGWLRHLALAQISRGSGDVYVTPQMVLAGDTLYITDSIGVVAALDPRSGAYQWLTVVANTSRTSVDLDSQGALSPPVLTKSGLVVALASRTSNLLLLDPGDGTILDDLSNQRGLQGARYILDAAGDVLIVTDNAAALWDGDRGELLWQTEHPQQSPRGLGDVARAFAVIPTGSGAFVLSLADGSVIGEIANATGNITVLDEEVLVSSDGQLHSYMSWDRAYDRLVRRIEQRPNDPDAGLALSSLALRQGGRRDAVMQGVDYAMAAIDRLTGDEAEAAGKRVFDRLRDLAGETREADPDLRLKLYDRLALASRSASQEVAYHLDFGRYLVGIGQPRQAVEHFQAVMVDPTFAGQSYLHTGQSQAAGTIAQRELERLVRVHGRSVYARFDALAIQRLEMLRSRPDTQAADFALVAQRYPLSEAASPALLAAAEALSRIDQPFGELSYCQQAVARALTPEQLDAALGAMLAVHLRTSSRSEAEHIIHWVERQFPGSRPVRNATPTELEDWLIAAASLGGNAIARIDLPQELSRAARYEGRLLETAPGLPASVTNAERFYLVQDGRLRRVDMGQPSEPRWEVELPASDDVTYLLADDRGQLLLWQVTSAHVLALDVNTGKAIWEQPADLRDALTPSDTVPQQNLLAQRRPSHPHVAVSPSVICFADPGGNVLAIDRYLGTVLWQYRIGVARVTSLAIDGWTLAVAGLEGPEVQLNHGRVMVMDLLTGEPRLDEIDLHVGFSPEFLAIDQGKLIVAGGSRAACFDLNHGDQLWTSRALNETSTGVFAAGGGVLTMEATDGIVYVLDVNDNGKLLGMHDLGIQFSTRQHSAANRSIFAADKDQVLFVSTSTVASFGAQPGGLLWRDGFSHRQQTLYGLALGTDRLAVVYAPADGGPKPNNILPLDHAVQFSVCIFDRDSGLLLSQTQIGPTTDQPDPRSIRAVQGGVLVPMGPATLLLTGQTSQAPDGQPR
ncbi:MAG: PQQ-binding-like beta-propeller repeat protein [Planctomycetota bacterium]